MDFATLPPEVNSGLMHSGPGAGPMRDAAAAWDRLAARLCTAAADYRAVTAKLAARCGGPASATITEAAAPYVSWLDTSAARSEHAASQAQAAASAYESARAAMVPPAAIDANRARRTALAAANCLGQTSPAIADAEAGYERMWVQDAEALYVYTGASAEASTLTAFTSPPTSAERALPRGNWTLTAAPEVISAGERVMAAIPEALQALSLSPRTALDASLSPVASALSKLSSLSVPSGLAVAQLNSMNKTAALQSLFPQPGAVSGATAIADFGRATSVGTLSVPHAWTAAATPNPIDVQGLSGGWVFEPVRLVSPRPGPHAG